MQEMMTRRNAVAVGAAAAALVGMAGMLDEAVTVEVFADDGKAAEAGAVDGESDVDVVVIGAGAAGLAAAATAAEAGAVVVVLEAGSFAGGATVYSGGHMLWLDDEFNAAQERNDADLQRYLELDPSAYGEVADDVRALQDQVKEYLSDAERSGRFDSVERVMVDHYMAGAGTDVDGNAVHLDYGMVRAAAEASMDMFAWLQSGGMEIKDGLYKDHANSPVNGGASLVEALLNLAEDAGAEVRYKTRATGLLLEGGVVVGVRYVGQNGLQCVLRAGRVIVATGGYASNGALAALYQNVGMGLTAACGTTNPPTNRGEGMAMAQRCGAAVCDLQFLVTVLEGYHGGCTLAETGKLVAAQQLVVNAQGVRFMDDSPSGPLKSTMNNKALNNQSDGLSFFIGDAKMIETLNEAKEGFGDELLERDWVYAGDTLEEAAQAAGLDAATVSSTVDSFNSMVVSGDDSDFGRTEFSGAVEQPPFVIAKMETHYHLTFGGLLIDDRARVLDVSGAPIEGLFAAGDVLCGYEGITHQSGDCLSVVVHTGIVAGTLA